MVSLVTVSGLSFEFSDGSSSIRDLSFSLSSGLTGLVGANGVGKTTLARLIAGELEPTEGSVQRFSSLAYLPQRDEPRDQTVAEFLTSDFSWSRSGTELILGIDLEKSCLALSGGEWMRVRLARALGDNYLILDEPTNDLDRSAKAAVLRFLREHNPGALVISHDRELLDLCGKIFELSNLGLRLYGCGWRQYQEERESERNAQAYALAAAERKRKLALSEQRERNARQEKRMRRGAAAGLKGGMPAILAGAQKRRAQATAGRIQSGALAMAEEAALAARKAFSGLKLDPVMYADLLGKEQPAQRLVAEARDLNIFCGRWLFEREINFSLRGNCRVAIKGANGAGKSTLLKAILGTPFTMKGELRRGELAALYLDQSCAELDRGGSVYDCVLAKSRLDEGEIRNGLARFLFVGDSAFRAVDTLSGGERMRAALARVSLSGESPELLVLDEPTNNLDLRNIEFLEGLVRSFRGPVIVISHDDIFLENCALSEEIHLSLG